MSAIDVDRVRTLLHDLQLDLKRQLGDLDPAAGEATGFDENFADSGQVAAEVGENVALTNQIREHLGEVEQALERLDAGTYGRCEICGNVIAAARLEAIPATRFCIDHA